MSKNNHEQSHDNNEEQINEEIAQEENLNNEIDNEELNTEEVSSEEELIGGEIGILKKQVENLENILKEKDAELLRRIADNQTFQTRMKEQAAKDLKFANQSLLKDFLPVIDNIELSLQHTEEGSSLREGIELTIKSFLDALAKHGVKEVDSSNGTIFDPTIHEAIMMDSNPEYENNAITLCVQKGYILNERVLRPAKVKVNKI